MDGFTSSLLVLSVDVAQLGDYLVSRCAVNAKICMSRWSILQML